MKPLQASILGVLFALRSIFDFGNSRPSHLSSLQTVAKLQGEDNKVFWHARDEKRRFSRGSVGNDRVYFEMTVRFKNNV